MAMRRTLVLLLGLALLGMRAAPVHAQEEVTLQIVGGGGSSTDPQARAIDAWIDQANPTVNHCAVPNVCSSPDVDVHVGTGGSGAPGQNQRAILQFDISRIPRSGIKSALLNLYLDTAQNTGAETWDVDQIMSFSSWQQARDVSWNFRTHQLTWSVAGGDFNPTPACQITPGATSQVALPSCDVTSAFMTFFGGLPPNANYGFLIKDTNEDATPLTPAALGLIASNSTIETPLAARAPALVVDFIQQVHSLTATPGNGQVVLNWTYPATVGTTTGTGLNPTTGVVILRNTGAPVEDLALIQDGTAPPVPVDCTTPVPGTLSTIVVYNGGTGLPTSFTDNTCITMTGNGNTYYYKVFAVASLGGGLYNYSQNGNTAAFLAGTADNSFAAEISATPNGTAGQQGPVWMAPVRSSALNPPSIDPGNYAIVAAGNMLVQGFNPTTGDDAIAPVSVGGIAAAAASARLPVLESTEADFGPNSGFGQIPMTYLAADDGQVYDVGLEPVPAVGSSGFVLDFLNPLNGAGVSGAYVGGVGFQAKAFSNSGNTKPNDVMIMGTNVVATPTTNVIFATNTCNLSAANPTGTGCLGSGGGGWNVPGGVVTSAGCSTALPTLAVCNMDVVMSTPFVDYKNNRVWVTSHNNADTVDANQPDVWELDANTGAVLAAVNLGIAIPVTNPTPGAPDIDSSPTGTQDQSLIFVGTNGGIVYAFDPTATDTLNGTSGPVVPHQVGTPSASLGDGPIQGFPLVANTTSPWLVVVTTNTTIQGLSFNGTAFTSLWNYSTASSTFGCTPSTPVAGPLLTNGSGQPIAIISCTDGQLHQINLLTGADEAQRMVDPGTPLGDPSLDVGSNNVIVGSTDGRVYAFKAPFL